MKLLPTIYLILFSFSLQAQFKEFLSKYITSNFPNSKIDTIKSISLSGIKQYKRFHQSDSQQDFQDFYQKPNLGRIEVLAKEKSKFCYDGESVYISSKITNYQPKNLNEIYRNDELGKRKETVIFFNGFLSRTYFLKKSLIDEPVIETHIFLIEGIECIKLVQKFDEISDNEYFFSKDKYHLIRENFVENGVIRRQIDYKNYQTLFGLFYPFQRIERSFLMEINNEVVINISNLKFNEVFPSGFFECKE